MATSPYFSTSNQYIKYDIHVDEKSQDIANNTTTIRVWVIAWRTNTGYTTYSTGTCYCTINGTSYSQSISSSQKIEYESDTVLFDKTVTIPHDADGKKTIYVSSSISHQRFSSSTNGFNVKLTDIPRKAEIVTAPDFRDIDNPVLKYKNPAGTAVTTLQACISLDGTTDNVAYRNISKSGTEYTFNLTGAERNTLLAACPNSNTLTVYFIVKSVLGGVTYYSSATKVMTVVNANPTISGVSYADTNPTTIAITSDTTKIIQAISTARFDFTTLTALKSATLSKIAVKINGLTVELPLSGTTQSNKSVTVGTINTSSDEDATIELTDSRGNKTTTAKTVTILEWRLPKAVISLQRRNNYYSETYLKVTSDISYLDGNNTVSIQYRYKQAGGSYNSYTSIADDTTVTLTLDNNYAYDFQIQVSDRLGTTTYNKTLSRGIPIIFFDRKRRAVSIGTLPGEDNELVVDRRIQLNNLLHERVADLWSWSSGDGTKRSASLYLYNQDGKMLARIAGREDGGYIDTYNTNEKMIARFGKAESGGGYIGAFSANGEIRAYIDDGTNGGNLTLNNSSNTYIGGFYAGTNGGVVQIKNNAGKNGGWFWVGGNGDGVLTVNDSSGNETASLVGRNGKLNCKTIRMNNGFDELYSGTLNSGSTTFSSDYSAYVLIGRVKSGGSRITQTIPKQFLESSPTRFQMTDEVEYITYNLSVSGSTTTLAFGTASTDGYIEKVYGML